jgi:hypothetical protein
MLQSTSAQFYRENETKYGFSMSQFKSQSGFQSGYELHFTVQPSKKAKVGFGLFYDSESMRLEGITITHQRMLLTGRHKLPVLQPFVMYNLIYRRTSTWELIATDDGISNSGSRVTYASLEHHLGMGFNINILNNVTIDCGLGYGLYLGSIKRPSNPDPITREISGTSGSGFIFKTGIAFKF